MAESRLKSQFASRLTSLCEERELPVRGRQTFLAKQFGVSQGAVRKWLTGEAFPELETAVKLADWFGVNVNWLVQGSGPKSGDKVETKAIVANDILQSGTQEMRKDFLEYIKFKVATAAEAMFPQEKRARTLKMIEDYQKASESRPRKH